MPIQHINPESLYQSPHFSHAVRVPAGADLIFVGGQNGVDAAGVVVGDGVAEQTRQAILNLRTCLEEAGAQLSDVVRWTILCVDGVNPQEGFASAADLLATIVPAPVITVAIVDGLAVPGAVVEIEAVAAVTTDN